MTDDQLEKLITALQPKPDPFQVNSKVLGVVSTILVAVGMWMGSSMSMLAQEVEGLRLDIAVLKTNVAVIDGNRFTVADALQMRREIEAGPPNAGALELIQSLESRVQRLEGYHPPGDAR